jgi:DNA repair exonuclease SbcCD nuclease subunit
MFRFVHTADLHLDSPLRSLALRDPALGDLVATASRTVLARIVDLCLAERADALLIAGDLFDGAVRSMKTAAFVVAQMERLAAGGVRVLMIRGNHDAESTVARELPMPPNVQVFDGRGGTERLAGGAVAVHGVSFAGRHAPESLLPKYPAPVPGAFNIGLLHTSLAGAEGHDPYAPCTAADLTAQGYDYWALGHVHVRAVHGERPWIVMPGMPQGRDIGEAGDRSVTLVTLDGGQATVAERPVSVVAFRRAGVDLTGVEDWRAALDRIGAALAGARGAADHAVVRLRLSGDTPLAWRLKRDADLLEAQAAEAARALGTVWLEGIEDRTVPPAAESGSDPRRDLVALMQALAGDAGFAAKAGALLEDLAGDLPPEVRPVLGTDAAARATVAARLAAEGIDIVAARLIGGDA